MTLEQAIKIAEQETRATVATIRDCGDRWAFAFKEYEGTLESLDVFIFKETGELEYFFMTLDNIRLLKNGKNVPLPEEAHND